MYRRSRTSSMLEGFSLSPLPYPVLLILAVISLLLGIQWYLSFESVVETTEESMGWVLLAIPLTILIVVRWLSSFETPERFFGFGKSPWERRRRMYYYPSEGSSPWGVAAVILLVLVLVQLQSGFREGWLIGN